MHCNIEYYYNATLHLVRHDHNRHKINIPYLLDRTPRAAIIYFTASLCAATI